MKFLNIKLVIIILLGSIIAVAQSPDITGLEYYFDTDPGFGNGVQVAVSPDSITSTTFDLDISTLDAGTHYAFIRAKDEDGVWSFIYKMIIQKVETLPVTTLDDIVDLEYFFDTDPGYGNGTPIAVAAGTVTSTTFDIDISGLSKGFHKVYFRSKDVNEIWSLIYTQNVVKVSEESIPPSTDIVAMEYFFDTDPGFGIGTPVTVTAGTITSTAFDIDLTGLSPGFHKVYFRSMDENDIWSLIYVQNLVTVAEYPLAPSTDIVAMEYFFDTDPGFGSGTPVAITAGTATSTAFDIDISGLSTSFHKVYFRTKNENDIWSLNYIQNLVTVAEYPLAPSTDIVAMEYFFDTDPGFGNGTPVPVTADTVTNTAFDIDISGLEAGYHKVYFRTKNENEVWSLAYIQNLVKVSVEPLPESPDIVAMEYFIDADPGFGNGTDVPIIADSLIDETFNIDVSALSPHDHNLYVRVMDENNSWSLIVVDTFNLAEVELTAYLEGPYSGGNMSTTLNSYGDLPLSQPFNVAPWNYDGDESVPSIPNVNIVDWILMEARNAVDAPSATTGTKIFRQAAFILNDGSVVDLDGTSNLEFKVHVDSNNFVVIYHRNHLSIMSAEDLSHSGWKYSYDFTTGSGQAYNSGQKDIGGVWGMFAGNADGNGEVHQNDINNVWKGQAGGNGYYSGDLDLNNEVNNQDKNDVWLPNVGQSSQIPE